MVYLLFSVDHGQEALETEVLKDRCESDSIVKDFFPRLKKWDLYTDWEGTITENIVDKIFLL